MTSPPARFPQTPAIVLQPFLHGGKQVGVHQGRHRNVNVLAGGLAIDRVRVLRYFRLATPGTQTRPPLPAPSLAENRLPFIGGVTQHAREIGRASCRERVWV